MTSIITLVGIGYIKVVFQRVPATFRVEHGNPFAVFVYPTLKELIPSAKFCHSYGIGALSID